MPPPAPSPGLRRSTREKRAVPGKGPVADPVRVGPHDAVVETITDAARPGNAAERQAQAETKAAQQKIIDSMLRCYRRVESRESTLRRTMIEDYEFYQGDQWPKALRAARESAGRPCLVVNRQPQFVRQVVNQARESKPGIDVNPVDSGSDPDTAEVLQDITRHVESTSNADIAYDRSSEHQAIMGRGYLGVVTEYDDDEGFALRIKIRGFRNPLRVFADEGEEPDGSDIEEAVVVQDLPINAFKGKFPHADVQSLEGMMSDGTMPTGWANGSGRLETIRIAEYWRTIYTKKTIAEIAFTSDKGPETLTIDQADLDQVSEESRQILGLEVLRTREVRVKQIRVALCSASEILDGNPDKTDGREWPGKWIPLVPVYGDEAEIKGVLDYRGMVRNAKDPQRMYNYWVSSATEAIALAPKAPWVITSGQLRGFESFWNNANTANYPYLPYKAESAGGRFAPPPQRRVEEPAIQAIMIALRQADNDLKAVMGLYDASLGQQGPEESGVALRTRQRQGEIANSNFNSNRARSIRHLGRIIVDLAPKVLDVPTVLRIQGQDGEVREMTVYANANPDLGAAGVPNIQALAAAEKVKGIYNLGVGRYDVSVSVGPSFRSRRQEAVEAILSIINSQPAMAPYLSDLLFKNSDWPDAKIIAKRLARIVPANAQDPKDGQPEIPPAVQQQMQQLQQQLEELQKLYQEAQQKLQGKAVEGQAKVQVAQTAAQAAVQAETMRQQGETERVSIQAHFEAQMIALETRLKAEAAAKQAVLESKLKSMEIQLEAKVAERPASEKPAA